MLEEAGPASRVTDGSNHRLALGPDTLAETWKWIYRQRTRCEALFDVACELSRGASGPEVIEAPGGLWDPEGSLDLSLRAGRRARIR